MATLTKWVLDPMHSEVAFKIKHLLISTVSGFFTSFEGQLETDSQDFTNAAIDFSIYINSIDTRQSQRDVHLKSADFFDAEKYPKILFKSTSFTKEENNHYLLVGNLTIRNVTKPVTLAVDYGGITPDMRGNTKAGFEITGKINRKDFGLVYNGVTEAGAIVLGEEIKLFINVELTKVA